MGFSIRPLSALTTDAAAFVAFGGIGADGFVSVYRVGRHDAATVDPSKLAEALHNA